MKHGFITQAFYVPLRSMSSYLSLLPSDLATGQLHRHLLGAIGPRPIAFASTVDREGTPNLSPFSFFNVFSANPPILIFSPARRVRNNTTKHTLENVLATHEVVINIVSYAIVEQMSLSSTEYPEGVNEFVKSGLTMVPSDLVQPFRVGESPVQFECKVQRVESLGDQGGAGNLIISEVVKMHINTDILDTNGTIDPRKIDQVSRMGGNWYSRASAGLFEVEKPLSTLGIGVDAIPEDIRNSHLLSGNDLGKLGNVETLPERQVIHEFLKEEDEIRLAVRSKDTDQIHQIAKKYLNENDVLSAWKVLLAND